jgi:hypothetical protein
MTLLEQPLSDSGLTVKSSLQVDLLGSVTVSGYVNSDGSFSLTGSNALGSVTVNNSGVFVTLSSPPPAPPVPQPLENTPADPNTWDPSNW